MDSSVIVSMNNLKLATNDVVACTKILKATLNNAKRLLANKIS